MVRWLFKQGVRRGFAGGSRPWMYLGVAAGVLRLFAKLAGTEEKVLFSEKLEPGQALVISNPAPGS